VKRCNEAVRAHFINFDNGEKQWIDLTQSSYKIVVTPEQVVLSSGFSSINPDPIPRTSPGSFVLRATCDCVEVLKEMATKEKQGCEQEGSQF
jgi:hypothetical protein